MEHNAVPAAAITVRNLRKSYGQVAAVDDVSFDIVAGRATALWGPNGAGKTTILRSLLGLARYEGTVSVNGIDPAADGRHARQQIGYVPQDLPIHNMRVGDLVAFIASLKKATVESGLAQVETFGIGDHLNKQVSELSGGMRQRLGLALAMIGSPPILFLDEPTANLDARGRAELLELLRGLKRSGLTLLFSSHRPEDVMTLADTVLVIEDGKLTGEVNPGGFADELGNRSRMVVYLRNGHRDVAMDTLVRLGLEPGGEGQAISVAIRPDQKAAILTTLVNEGVDIEDFEVERISWTDLS